MSAEITQAQKAQPDAPEAGGALSPTPTFERLASMLCDQIEAYLRAGDDCVPPRLRTTSETDVVHTMFMLRAQIERIKPDAQLGIAGLRETYLRLRAPEVARLKATLQRVYEEVRDFPAQRPFSSDSYLPHHLVDEIATVLGQSALAPR